MEYIKKSLSKPTDWLLVGVVICLIVLVIYNRTVEHATNTNDEDEPTTSGIPSLPKVNVQVNELPVSQEALRHAIGEVYKADISAIKNLSDIAKALQEGNGIKIPGKLVVNGETDLVGSVKKLKVDGETNLVGNVNANGKLTVDGELLINPAPGKVPFMKGIIVMWSGAEKDVPAGWVLCDGTNNTTPDLRGRFVLASGNGTGLAPRPVNEKGGAEQIALTIEQMPKHSHSFGKDYISGSLPDTGGLDLGDTANMSNDYASKTNEQGGDKPFSIMPPYYVLAYIMKL